jgi:hypothetical protein
MFFIVMILFLYVFSDTCAYLLDRTKPCICVGRTPKPLTSQYNVRSGTEIAVEVYVLCDVLCDTCGQCYACVDMCMCVNYKYLHICFIDFI